MVSRRTVVAAVLAASLVAFRGAAQTPPRNPPPPTPWIAFGACPGEGCSFGGVWTACTTLVVRKEKRADAPLAFTLHRGDHVTALTGDVHVDLPGMVVFRDTVTYVPEPEARSQDTVRFSRADTLYLLNYLGEGFLVWWIQGHAQVGQIFWWTWPEPNPDPAPRAVLIRPTRAVWWVRVRNSAGTEGWLVPGFSTGARYDIGMAEECPRR